MFEHFLASTWDDELVVLSRWTENGFSSFFSFWFIYLNDIEWWWWSMSDVDSMKKRINEHFPYITAFVRCRDLTFRFHQLCSGWSTRSKIPTRNLESTENYDIWSPFNFWIVADKLFLTVRVQFLISSLGVLTTLLRLAFHSINFIEHHREYFFSDFKFYAEKNIKNVIFVFTLD